MFQGMALTRDSLSFSQTTLRKWKDGVNTVGKKFPRAFSDVKGRLFSVQHHFRVMGGEVIWDLWVIEDTLFTVRDKDVVIANIKGIYFAHFFSSKIN